MTKNRIWIILVLWVAGWNLSFAQVNISALAGGGISDLQNGFPFSDNSALPDYFRPCPLIQLGAAISSTFRKEGMLSWQVQLIIRRSALKNLLIDSIEYKYTNITTPEGDVIESITDIIYHRDYDNIYRWNHWSVNIPMFLNFQVFGPIGWKIGGNANYILSEFPDEDKIKINGGYPSLDTKFESFNWQGHIGFFTTLGPKIRLEALAFSDFKPRLTHGEYSSDGQPVFPEYREMGLYLNVLYKLNR